MNGCLKRLHGQALWWFGVPSAARRVRPYRICLRRRVSFVPAGHAVSGQPLSEQADAAWRAGNYAEAERLYNVVARDAALPTEQRALAWERVARAALSSGNMQGAQNALKFWKDLVPGAKTAPRGLMCGASFPARAAQGSRRSVRVWWPWPCL